jgi:hypothetical protein
MSTSVISSLGLTAGAGLYANVGLIINAEFTANIAGYNSIPPIANLLAVIDSAIDTPALAISANTLANLVSLGGNVNGNFFPALGDSVASNVQINVGSDDYRGLTRELQFAAEKYLGDGNYAVFCQAFAAADAYVSTTNDVIFSADQANRYLGPTFTGMDDLITGDITKINLASESFGSDLENLGSLINFANINFFGTPAGLLNQLSREGNMLNGTTPAVRAALIANGLTDADIRDLVNLNVESLFNPTGLTSDAFDRLQKSAYAGLCAIKGSDLDDVLQILAVTTSNINSMCELLDPRKIFPSSYSSLTMPMGSKTVLIYDDDGSVSSDIAPLLNSGSLAVVGCENLAKVIPPDQAAANRALQVSFGQIKNISAVDSPQLAQAVKALGTLRDLPLLANVATPISSSVQNFYATDLATGSGPLGSILLTDVLGTPTGIGVVEYLAPVINAVNTMITNNQLTDLINIYARMRALIQGDYGVPPTITIPGGPGAGTYASYNSALQSLITAADQALGSVISNQPLMVGNINSLWVDMTRHLQQETLLQARAGIDFEILDGLGQNEVTSFLLNLTGYGLDTQVGMSAQYLQKIADTATTAGQAVIATMREGRNNRAMDQTAIGHDNAVPDVAPVPLPQADLGDEVYTPAQARALVQARLSPG